MTDLNCDNPHKPGQNRLKELKKLNELNHHLLFEMMVS
jgi:hypothetical protein